MPGSPEMIGILAIVLVLFGARRFPELLTYLVSCQEKHFRALERSLLFGFLFLLEIVRDTAGMADVFSRLGTNIKYQFNFRNNL
jgi:mttA/Hcf106 family